MVMTRIRRSMVLPPGLVRLGAGLLALLVAGLLLNEGLDHLASTQRLLDHGVHTQGVVIDVDRETDRSLGTPGIPGTSGTGGLPGGMGSGGGSGGTPGSPGAPGWPNATTTSTVEFREERRHPARDRGQVRPRDRRDDRDRLRPGATRACRRRGGTERQRLPVAGHDSDRRRRGAAPVGLVVPDELRSRQRAAPTTPRVDSRPAAAVAAEGCS